MIYPLHFTSYYFDAILTKINCKESQSPNLHYGKKIFLILGGRIARICKSLSRKEIRKYAWKDSPSHPSVPKTRQKKSYPAMVVRIYSNRLFLVTAMVAVNINQCLSAGRLKSVTLDAESSVRTVCPWPGTQQSADRGGKSGNKSFAYWIRVKNR